MINCRLCNTPLDVERGIKLGVPAGTQLFSDQARTALQLKSTIAILECHSCGLIQLAGDPVVYSHVSSSSSFVSSQLTEHRLKQLHGLLDLRASSDKYGSMLEIGCGDGHLLEQSKDMFRSSVGIEPAEHNAKAAAARGLSVHQRLMGRETKVEGAPFDYFCSFHVMEHVTDICSVLQGIRRNLSDDAVGIIEVPATEAAIEHQRFGDFMPDHLNYYTENTMHTALEWNGFVVIRIYRDYGGEHLVAYVRKRSGGSSLSFIADRQQRLAKLVATVNKRRLPFAIWGVSHHVMPYIATLGEIKGLIATDGSPSKIGRFIPSTSIRVQDIAVLSDLPHGYIAITAPRFHEEIACALAKKFPSVVVEQELSALLGFDVLECRANIASDPLLNTTAGA